MSTLLSPDDIVRSGLCIGCGSCVGQSALKGVSMMFDSDGQLKPAGPTSWLRTPSIAFTETCPFSPTAKNEDQLAAALYPETTNVDEALGRFQTAYVGHV